MPVGKWGRLEVDGRRVLVFDGINTQTVNVYEGADDDGKKQIIIRLHQPQFTSAEQLSRWRLDHRRAAGLPGWSARRRGRRTARPPACAIL